MNNDGINKKPDRRSIRLREYDYSQNGAYFITICTHDRICLFGEIIDGIVHLNDIGRIIAEEWEKTSLIRPEVIIDEYVIMPNHLHGIIFIDRQTRATQRVAPTELSTNLDFTAIKTLKSKSLGAIVGQIKSISTKRINQFRATQRVTPTDKPIWQRNFFEHVIRNEKSLDAIRRYIYQNPLAWEKDPDNPNVEKKEFIQKDDPSGVPHTGFSEGHRNL